MRSRRSLLQTCAQATALTTCFGLDASASAATKWVVFYGATAPEEVLARYELVVLDPMFQGSVAEVAKNGTRVCGYLSVGELRKSDAAFQRIDPAVLLEENAAWPGTHRVDVRHRQWAPFVIDELIPAIVAKKFSGLLLDTLDTPAFLEQTAPLAHQGMTQASVDLVRAIRRAHPRLMLIANRGYAILPQIVGSIDAILAESLLTKPGQDGQTAHTWNDAAEVQLQLSLLAPAYRRRGAVAILGLEYWDVHDPIAIEQIYAMHRRLGHCPYVATRLLDTIVPEPKV